MIFTAGLEITPIEKYSCIMNSSITDEIGLSGSVRDALTYGV